MEKIVETERLYLRKMTEDDFDDLCVILKDAEVMYAYEHAFSDDEVREWLDRQLGRYARYGFGLWGVILKETGTFIGQCGITMQETPDGTVPEIGYLFAKKYWHCGYASEAAQACRKYAFETLGFLSVYSIIRDINLPSQAVARRNGMTVSGRFVKHYYNIDMPHLIFRVSCEKGESNE